MIAPDFPTNEVERQRAVERYDILDTLAEVDYDSITSLMAKISGAPVSLITMLDHDRNYLKSHHGVPFDQSPREISFCGHAINAEEPITVIENAEQDHRFIDNPLVTEGGVRFYAGVPLVTPDKYRLGTLCLFDMKPRVLDDETKSVLLDMAKQVETLLEYRYQNKVLINVRKQLESRNSELEYFARIISHDIKAPIVGTAFMAEALVGDHSEELSEEALSTVNKIRTSVSSVGRYIDGILEYYTSDKIFIDGNAPVNLNELIEEVRTLTTGLKDSVQISSNAEAKTIININRGALLQILVNLVTNSIKYCEKEIAIVNIEMSESKKHYSFTVSDNGIGIEENRINSIFDLFSKGDHQGIVGSGMGLSTVKKLVNHTGGEISFVSTANEGATFLFTLGKDSYGAELT